MNTLAHLVATAAIADFALDMFNLYNERLLGIAILGMFLIYVLLTMRGLFDDWGFYLGDKGDAFFFTRFSWVAVGITFFIVGIKVAHTIWV